MAAGWFVANRFADKQGGMLMIEVLVTILIVSLGMLGIAAMFVRSQQFNDEAYQRYQALDIAHELSEQLSTNSAEAKKKDGSAYLTDKAGGASFTRSSACTTCDSAAMAKFDITRFHDALLGAQKTQSGTKVASLIGARGCVEYRGVAGSETNPPRFRISVVWQGRQFAGAAFAATTTDPTTCGDGLYKIDEKDHRRVISLEVQVL